MRSGEKTMAQLQEKVSLETIIPFFNLLSTKGGKVRTWDFKQRKNLVILIFGMDCAECKDLLQGFAQNYYEYRRLNTEILAISTAPLDELKGLAQELSIPYHLLSDETGEAINKYTHTNPDTKQPFPSLFIADRYGSLEDEWIVQSGKDLPKQEDVLSLLQLFELRCPE